MRVYLSRSFREEDEPVVRAIRQALSSMELRRTGLELTDSKPPRGERILTKITNDIDRSDAVVCVFTRRHRIGRTQRFSAPGFVVAEAAYAIARGSRLILLLERGIHKREMGLAHSTGIEFLEFDRDTVQHVDFADRLRELARVQLTDALIATPGHHFRKYQVRHSVYPGGYTLTHYRIVAHVLRDRWISHRFGVGDHVAETLPSSDQMICNADEVPCPYPKVPFVAFSTPHDGVQFRPRKGFMTGPDRRFEVRFPRLKQDFEYQWMWGCPGLFNDHRRLEYNGVALAVRPVDRAEVTLRVARQVKRERDPGLAFLSAAVAQDWLELADLPDDKLEEMLESALAPTRTDESPTHRSYEFVITPVPRATNLMVLY